MSNFNNFFQPNSQAHASATTASFNFSSSFSASTSSTSAGTNIEPQHTSHHYSKQINADPSGATVRTSRSRDGGQPTVETKRYDAPGRRVEGGNTEDRRRIEDVTDKDEESYEEKMEDEYAKREGGA